MEAAPEQAAVMETAMATSTVMAMAMGKVQYKVKNMGIAMVNKSN